MAAACVRAIGRWDECLLWIQTWGVWPSGEDWPAYYALRGDQGERRSLDTAPGHLFETGEHALFSHFVTLVMENAWDADIIVVPKIMRIHIDHDELVELRSNMAIEFAPPTF